MLGVHGHGLMDPAAVFQQGFHAPPTPRQNNRLTSRRPPSSRGRDDSSETDGSSHRVAHTLTACCRCRQVSRRPPYPASSRRNPPSRQLLGQAPHAMQHRSSCRSTHALQLLTRRSDTEEDAMRPVAPPLPPLRALRLRMRVLRHR